MTTRNTNARFDLAPTVAIERSTMTRDCNVKTSFNVGELVPFFLDEVLPGDTFQIETSKVMRLQTLITPVMDNMYLDTYYFFVPNRLIWEHWRNLMGENTSSAWIPSVEYSVPQIEPPSGGWATGGLADYFGLPVGNLTYPKSVSVLPFRAYALIYNEWFRDENLMDPLNIPMGDTTVTGVNTGNYVTDVAKGGKPAIACKYHDYFTSCLPAPQKTADEVSVLNGLAPVITVHDKSVTMDDWDISPISKQFVDGMQVKEANYVSQTISNLSTTTNLMQKRGEVSTVSGGTSPNTGAAVLPTNLYANLYKTTGTTINALRQAFAIQRLFEKDARSGSRYIECIKAHFNVESPDARLQRPEYLGGNRVPLNIEQALQTSSTDSTSPLGSLAGWSQTNDVSYDVNKSFTEHGLIIGVMCARYDHSYQQGIERMWRRKKRFDYYWPALAHIGEQAVYTSEIYADVVGAADGSEIDVFGYQEAWAEYRYKPNYITGEMRSAYATSLDIWHFADDYSSKPTLSDSWIREDKAPIDRTLAVKSSVSNQVFGDIFIKNKCTRPMPLYSIPGLIDHF